MRIQIRLPLAGQDRPAARKIARYDGSAEAQPRASQIRLESARQPDRISAVSDQKNKNSNEIPAQGRLAGIDFGTVRIGIAVTDPQQRIASPFANYSRGSDAADAEYFRRLVAAEDIVGFVIGLPVHASGLESKKSIEARRFGEWLSRETGLPVAYFDERYTSIQAEGMLLNAQLTKKKRKQRLDMLAAQIILASFLEAGRRDEEPGALGD